MKGEVTTGEKVGLILGVIVRMRLNRPDGHIPLLAPPAKPPSIPPTLPRGPRDEPPYEHPRRVWVVGCRYRDPYLRQLPNEGSSKVEGEAGHNNVGLKYECQQAIFYGPPETRPDRAIVHVPPENMTNTFVSPSYLGRCNNRSCYNWTSA